MAKDIPEVPIHSLWDRFTKRDDARTYREGWNRWMDSFKEREVERIGKEIKNHG